MTFHAPICPHPLRLEPASSPRRSCHALRLGAGRPAAGGAAATPAAEPDRRRPPGTPASEVELNLINLPTTMSLKKHQSYFRLTHRFARDLRRGDFGPLAEDLFSLDNGAVIGLEYRFGITSHLQAGVHRTTLSKTIQFFGRYDAWRQSELAAGSDLGARIGRRAGELPPELSAGRRRDGRRTCVGSLAEPLRHARRSSGTHARPTTSVGHEGHDHDLPEPRRRRACRPRRTRTFVGFGARFRIRPTVFVVGEYAPRVSGHDPGGGDVGCRDREADGGPHAATEFHQRVRHDARRDRARRQHARRVSRVQPDAEVLEP